MASAVGGILILNSWLKGNFRVLKQIKLPESFDTANSLLSHQIFHFHVAFSVYFSAFRGLNNLLFYSEFSVSSARRAAPACHAVLVAAGRGRWFFFYLLIREIREIRG